MADDVKRDENVCFKVTEQMLIDLGRCCALADRKPSDFMFHLLRSHLYGSMVHWKAVQAQSTKGYEVDQP